MAWRKRVEADCSFKRPPPLGQITFSAISDDLRDKQRFPSVLRTVPGADHHVEAMVQLLLHFHWNWIVVLVSSDSYGRWNSRLLREHLARHDICIALHEVLPTLQPSQVLTRTERRRLEAIVDKLQHSSARVVVVFSPDLVLHHFFHQVLRQNVTGVVWIASESWAIDLALHNLTGLSHTGTFLGITIQSVSMPGFSEFRERRAQARTPASHRSSWGSTCNQECDTCLDTLQSFNTILTLSGERVAYSVYSAVYAVAHALHSLLGCSPTHCSKAVVYPWRVRQARATEQAQSLRLPWRAQGSPISSIASLSIPRGFWANGWRVHGSWRQNKCPSSLIRSSPSKQDSLSGDSGKIL